MPDAAQDPRRQPARTVALTGVIGDGGGRRAFVDATGASVLPPSAIRRVATDDRTGALLLMLGAPLVGCAGRIDGTGPDGVGPDGVESVGESRAPDPEAVAALRPDVIVAGAIDRVHDLADARLVDALRRVAPVVAVALDRPAHAAADLRALLATVPVEPRNPARPVRERPSSPPVRPSPW